MKIYILIVFETIFWSIHAFYTLLEDYCRAGVGNQQSINHYGAAIIPDMGTLKIF